jgi:hypothetical protein
MRKPPLLILGAALFGLIAVFASPASAASAERSTSDVWRFAEGTAVDGSWSTLTRTNSGVTATIKTIAPPGDTVTVWWVVFNNPEECVHGEGDFRCGEEDLFEQAIQASVQHAAGHVVDADGDYNIGAHLRVGDTSGCDLEQLGPEGFLCAGLIDPRGADIHLVVRTHGPALDEFMPGQIRSFAGGCTPDTSLGLGDGPNECIDMQFAIHGTLWRPGPLVRRDSGSRGGRESPRNRIRGRFTIGPKLDGAGRTGPGLEPQIQRLNQIRWRHSAYSSTS